MNDLFAHLKTLDLDQLRALDLGSVAQPFDDAPSFDTDANPEIDAAVRLDGDRRHVTLATQRYLIDFRANPEAYRHLDPLPKTGEALHGIISGNYALSELVPAIVERSGRKIAELHLATLGFNKQNGADLCAMIDSVHNLKASLLVSY